jgi:hypothetical protein
MENWLARQKALADRQSQLDALRFSISDLTEANGESEEN